MTSAPSITVIVPGFDVAEFAEDALASLREQTREDWRAVLVDDGSTDATGALFDAAAAAEPRFQVVHHPERRGLSAARNTGLDLVETPYVGFLDADDVMLPSALAHLVGTLERTGSDLAVGAYVRLRPDGRGGYAPGDVQPWVAAATDPARERTTLAEHPDASGNIVAWSKASRLDLWRREHISFPEGKSYEDQVVTQQLYTRARGFDVIPDVVVQWRERADGSSITQHKGDLPVLRDYLEALEAGMAVLEDAGYPAALASRVRLIQTLDLPPLVEIALTHPDDEYRRELGASVRALVRRSPDPVPDTLEPALAW